MTTKRPAPVIIGSSLTFVFLATASAIACYYEKIGLALAILAVAGVACIARYRLSSTGFAGSLALLPALLIFIYITGAVDRESPVLSTNVSPLVQTIIVGGSFALIFGLWLGTNSERSERILERCDFQGSGIFFWSGVAAVVVSAVNYATGDIALFSKHIDYTRFNANFGVLGFLSSVVIPITQVTVIIFLLKLQTRTVDARWAVLAACGLISLTLTAGRSLVAIPLIAFGILLVDLKRPKVLAVLLVVAAGLLAFGALGQARTAAQNDDFGSTKQGARGWIETTDWSLQTGPRVMTLAIERVDGEFLGGQFLIADLPHIRDSSITGADRLVTQLLGRNPVQFGGLPPTIFGGLYLDFSWMGVLLGALLVGALLAFSRRLMCRTPNLANLVWFSYFAAYISISVYSYVSFRPSWIVVLVICVAAKLSARGVNGASSTRLEVQELSGRS